MNDLVDTTEMYLRTVYELEEEGITPLRARIAERLSQSGPTVSQTVARMERDGLVTVEGDRHLELTDFGRALATRVMRKHRLAERLLTDVIGLPLDEVHIEACRWEHVMSEAVERRLVVLLDHPTHSPYGNPIPGLSELSEMAPDDLGTVFASLDQVATDGQPKDVVIRRISEPLQSEPETIRLLQEFGATPGVSARVSRVGSEIRVETATGKADLPLSIASHLHVETA